MAYVSLEEYQHLRAENDRLHEELERLRKDIEALQALLERSMAHVTELMLTGSG